MKRLTLAVLLLLACAAMAGVDDDWRQIEALDAGPKAQWKTRNEARVAALAHLDVQEKALRNFVAQYPSDPRRVDAQLRLVHLLAARADLQENAKPRAEAAEILERMDVPKNRVADVEFAKVSLFMRRVKPGDDSMRAMLANKIQDFKKSFPDDRRVAPLLAELATLYDAEPQRKKTLLEEARTHAPSDDLRRRIDDDLTRVSLLGKPLDLKFTSLQGDAIDVEKLLGKVVLVYFFAEWSPPSVAVLDAVHEIAGGFPTDKVQPLGISLDENPDTAKALLKAHKINWPVYCDGKGWESPLVHSFGVNSLPTFWILDRAGKLRTLNARDDAPALIAQLLREN